MAPISYRAKIGAIAFSTSDPLGFAGRADLLEARVLREAGLQIGGEQRPAQGDPLPLPAGKLDASLELSDIRVSQDAGSLPMRSSAPARQAASSEEDRSPRFSRGSEAHFVRSGTGEPTKSSKTAVGARRRGPTTATGTPWTHLAIDECSVREELLLRHRVQRTLTPAWSSTWLRDSMPRRCCSRRLPPCGRRSPRRATRRRSPWPSAGRRGYAPAVHPPGCVDVNSDG